MKIFNKLRKYIFLLIICGLAYIFYNPSIIKNDQIRDKVMGIRDETPEYADSVINQSQKIYKNFSENTQVPNILSNSPETIVVDDVVNELVNQIKQLPEKQVERVKVEICREIMEKEESDGQ